MQTEAIIKLIMDNYEIGVDKVTKIKNVYKLEGKSEKYCLKIVHYEYGHFLFILEAMKHLINRGFNNVLKIIKNREGKEYIKFGENYAYLTKWAIARECNYDNPLDLVLASSTLASLHKKSEGFVVTKEMHPRYNWLKWPEVFTTRIDEMLDFNDRIQKKDNKTEFDYRYKDVIDKEINRANRSIMNLNKTDYCHKMKTEMKKNGYCHHDFAHHNVLIDKEQEVVIIDFDYCILDTHLHDLSSLLIRKMKNGKWDMDNALYVLDAYNSIYSIEKSDIPVMTAFMEFPQDFWQVGIQYYWEKQPWGEEFFLNKLKKIELDIDERQEFLEKFRNLDYGG
ncbi:spore coat protein, CotS family [Clostridium pasteurianum DSM 525 = ATCC 6013]|uniref:Spore coat protein, CotS family n=1 Tax=Clostridium pasteurianum DSM 525 = ATCC 6013 TaxID=1262449 RepID=A0A0H3J348_CLOPA|nr:CotS family spore coat protein [Clostridium pasteurianum]AJA46338.1 spore coat protein, CotS family [Clostridium pasteurianum DSM 525 = ATCC 6013]AJA50326.1 spore coat protein, CotS family [Clostridium pasteurianum DSM 525 = ATCC 6013]AOZ73780.1 spore coat protein [Clostridium pasteurianum DSM 525 = ATCC 6013]AOZ77577.1 spore coat protein [Clostridium pasteurianum]ELP60915.1 spore coat protein [Clostridium pasteurianum DSM 525 = ATCC 6013]